MFNPGTTNHFTKLFEAAASVSKSSTSGNFLEDQASVNFYVSSESANRTVFLADLPKSTSYLHLSTYFEEQVGPCVISIKRPLFKQFYFAFVQFNKTEHAKKVLDDIRYPEINGVQCRALKYNKSSGPNSIDKKQSSFQLFVKGIPRSWMHQDLHETFEEFGKILSAKVSIDGDFKSRGYGFVQYETLEAAQKAIQEINGKDFSKKDSSENSIEVINLDEDAVPEQKQESCVISVVEYIPKNDRSGLQQPKCSTNLYVKNFPKEFSDMDLSLKFEKYGEIVSAVVMKDQNQVGRGFGFVCFRDWQDAQKALDEFGPTGSGHSVEKIEESLDSDGKSKPAIFVCEAKTKEQRSLQLQKSTYQFKKSMQLMNLVVKNVDASTTKQEFEDFFGAFGQVCNSKLIPEAQLGFVSFQDRDSARNAKEQASNKTLKGRCLTANFCEPKESRRVSLEEQFDKKAYERQRISKVKSENSDILALINSINILLNFTNGNQGQNINNNSTTQRTPFELYQHSYRSTPNQNHQSNNFRQNNFNQRVDHTYNQNNQYQKRPYQGQGNRGGQQMQQQVRYMQGQNQMPQAEQKGYAAPGPTQISPQFPFHVANGQQFVVAPQTLPTEQILQPMAMPTHPDIVLAQIYGDEIKAMFMSQAFKESPQVQRREFVGSAIYKYVESMLGPEIAPKITGMIIDLPLSDLNMSVLHYHSLQQKVSTALQLLAESNTLSKGLSDKAKLFLENYNKGTFNVNVQSQFTVPQQVSEQQNQKF